MKSQRIVLAIMLCFGCKATAEPTANDQGTVHSAEPKPSAGEVLERLDERRPVPLLPMMAAHQKENMRQHLQAVQEVVAAVAVGNFEKSAAAARRMGFFGDDGPNVCAHGSGRTGFHRASSRLSSHRRRNRNCG